MLVFDVVLLVDVVFVWGEGCHGTSLSLFGVCWRIFIHLSFEVVFLLKQEVQ